MSPRSPLDPSSLTAARLEAIFDSPDPLTIGIEEEVMLLDPETLHLSPTAPKLLDRLQGDPRFKSELPVSQVEIITPPTQSASEAVGTLARGRRDLAHAADGLARPAVAGVHPFSPATGELVSTDRYEHIRAEYGEIARRQLVASLQVHVAVGNASRTLGVYNALREYLPEIAALAANAAIYEGRDSGLASVRPKIAEMLPRQGIPPTIASWDDLAEEFRWGAAAGVVRDPRLWWWELRPHTEFGTLEIRVADAQTSLADASGMVGFIHCLVDWLSDRHDAGEGAAAVPSWRIEENRWSAARYGVAGRMADLETGKPKPTRERLHDLLSELRPVARRLGCDALLANASRLVEANGAMRQRELFESVGAVPLTAALAERFLDDRDGLEAQT